MMIDRSFLSLEVAKFGAGIEELDYVTNCRMCSSMIISDVTPPHTGLLRTEIVFNYFSYFFWTKHN